MRIAVVFDTPYAGWHHPEHERQMTREVAAWHDIRVPGFATWRPGESLESRGDLRYAWERISRLVRG